MSDVPLQESCIDKNNILCRCGRHVLIKTKYFLDVEEKDR